MLQNKLCKKNKTKTWRSNSTVNTNCASCRLLAFLHGYLGYHSPKMSSRQHPHRCSQCRVHMSASCGLRCSATTKTKIEKSVFHSAVSLRDGLAGSLHFSCLSERCAKVCLVRRNLPSSKRHLAQGTRTSRREQR